MSERRPRRPWTAEDDAHLRKFNAEGKKDHDLAYILGREVGAIRRRRWRLGLPGMGKPGPGPGFKMSAEASAKLSERNKRRWQDPDYRAKYLPLLAIYRDKANRQRFRRPDESTPQGKLYKKIADALGAKVARAQLDTILGQ